MPEDDTPMYRCQELGILISWQPGWARGIGYPDTLTYGISDACNKMWGFWPSWGAGELTVLDTHRFAGKLGEQVYANFDEYLDAEDAGGIEDEKADRWTSFFEAIST